MVRVMGLVGLEYIDGTVKDDQIQPVARGTCKYFVPELGYTGFVISSYATFVNACRGLFLPRTRCKTSSLQISYFDSDFLCYICDWIWENPPVMHYSKYII